MAPSRPVGAKLELTYSCNLRCGFCYTDSPRRTLERATDLSDDQWRRIVEDVIDVGVIEAVVTGGEPLLRRELALEVAERLDTAGVATCFNTNGWFVDESVADRLAALEGGSVHISLDGATAELHERARGVPGSWRRAVRAISLLLDRGARLQVIHVVTPDNAGCVEELIEQVWLLGVPSLRITPVALVGAAARGGDWAISRSRLVRLVERARQEFGEEFDLRVDSDPVPGDPVLAPAFFLVRPNGGVMPGSASPFRFGDAIEDGLEACWQRIVSDWNHPTVQEWREPILRGARMSETARVIYRDEEAEVSEPLPLPSSAGRPVKLPPNAATATGSGDVEDASDHVRSLALARRYRLGSIRWTSDQGDRYVRCPTGSVSRLNAAASTVMDACADGTPADAVSALATRYPNQRLASLERDALRITRGLVRRGVLTPALCTATRFSSPQPVDRAFAI